MYSTGAQSGSPAPCAKENHAGPLSYDGVLECCPDTVVRSSSRRDEVSRRRRFAALASKAGRCMERVDGVNNKAAKEGKCMWVAALVWWAHTDKDRKAGRHRPSEELSTRRERNRPRRKITIKSGDMVEGTAGVTPNKGGYLCRPCVAAEGGPCHTDMEPHKGGQGAAKHSVGVRLGRVHIM